MGVFNQDNTRTGERGPKGDKGDNGNGFNLTHDGNYDLGNKQLTNVATPISNNHTATKEYVDTEIAALDFSPFLKKDGSVTMTGNIDIGGNKITNVDEGTSDDDCVTKKQLDLKLDRATFVISNSLPGIPVLDGISIALIPSLSVLTTDADDRVSSWLDPVNNVTFTQTSNSKKPLLLRDSVKKKFFIRFDGSDDYLENSSFDVSKVAGQSGNTCTVIIIANTKQTKYQSQFQWGKGAVRFGVHLPWINGACYIDFGSTSNGRLAVSSLANLTGNIEVFTVRVDGHDMEFFRGISSMTPVGTGSISATLTGSAQEMFIGCQVHTDGSAINFCEMDLYAFAVWQKSLTNQELRNMYRFIEDYFDL